MSKFFDGIQYSIKIAIIGITLALSIAMIVSPKPEEIRFTVTFNSQGGSAVASIPAHPDAIITMPDNPIKNGHNFINWYKNEELTDMWDFSNDKVTEDITLYARWNPSTYFAINDGVVLKQVVFGKEFDLGVPTSQDNDVKFAGWFTQEEGKGEKLTGSNGISISPWRTANNIFVFAHWLKLVPKELVFELSPFDFQSYRLVSVSQGEGTLIDIPAEYDDGVNGKWPVTAILGFAFSQHCEDVEEIILPNTVVELTFNTFNKGFLPNLKSLTIPFTGDAADFNNSNNTNFGFIFGETKDLGPEEVIPDSLTTVTVSNTTRIVNFAFRGVTSIQTIILGESITHIGADAFLNCVNLSNVIFQGKQIENINREAFKNTALTNIVLPNSLRTLGNGVFEDCTNLITVFIPNTVTDIGTHAFANCVNLETITFESGSSLLTIGEWAFANTNISHIVIPDSLATIGSNLFTGTNLISLTIPFIGNTILSEMGAKYLGYLFGAISYQTQNESIPSSLNTITITLESVFANTFYECKFIETVYLLNATHIGTGAFRRCSGLKTILFSDKLFDIQAQAFIDCDSLETIFYSGSNISKWNDININPNGNAFLNENIIYFLSTIPNSRHWYFNEDGIPTLYLD